MERVSPSLIRQQCMVNGRWIGEPETAVYNPATGAAIARVPNFGATETKAAIEAAHRAFPGWSGRLAKERSAILRRWFDLQLRHAEELAQLMTAEQGKPLAEARGEVAYGASFVEFYAEEAKRIYGETIPTHKKGGRIIVHKQPIGVVGAITPWNFPFAMITRKVAPAIATGCTVVVKPAPDTPLTALALAALAEEAGLPGWRLERHNRRCGGNRQGVDLEPAGARDRLHRIDPGGQDPDEAIRVHGEKGFARTRRQCAFHRVRRRRSR